MCVFIQCFTLLTLLKRKTSQVGVMSFFSMISSIVLSGSAYRVSDAALSSYVDVLEERLRKRMALNVGGSTTWELLPFEKRKVEQDAELSSKCLGIMVGALYWSSNDMLCANF